MSSYDDISKLDKKALQAKKTELEKQLFEHRMQKATSGLEKPHQYKSLKKDIARVSTAYNSKES